MSDWLVFFSHNWILFILLFLIVGSLISGLFEIFAFLIGALLIMVFFFDYKPSDVFNMAKNAYEKTYSKYEETLKPKLDQELNDAVVEKNTDGSYTIKTANFLLFGKEGGNDINIKYKETEFSLDFGLLGDEILSKIEKIQKEGSPTSETINGSQN